MGALNFQLQFGQGHRQHINPSSLPALFLQDLGQHTLVCSTAYTGADGDGKYLPQYYKFASANPLSVRTKVYSPLLSPLHAPQSSSKSQDCLHNLDSRASQTPAGWLHSMLRVPCTVNRPTCAASLFMPLWCFLCDSRMISSSFACFGFIELAESKQQEFGKCNASLSHCELLQEICTEASAAYISEVLNQAPSSL